MVTISQFHHSRKSRFMIWMNIIAWQSKRVSCSRSMILCLQRLLMSRASSKCFSTATRCLLVRSLTSLQRQDSKLSFMTSKKISSLTRFQRTSITHSPTENKLKMNTMPQCQQIHLLRKSKTINFTFRIQSFAFKQIGGTPSALSIRCLKQPLGISHHQRTNQEVSSTSVPIQLSK